MALLWLGDGRGGNCAGPRSAYWPGMPTGSIRIQPLRAPVPSAEISASIIKRKAPLSFLFSLHPIHKGWGGTGLGCPIGVGCRHGDSDPAGCPHAWVSSDKIFLPPSLAQGIHFFTLSTCGGTQGTALGRTPLLEPCIRVGFSRVGMGLGVRSARRAQLVSCWHLNAHGGTRCSFPDLIASPMKITDSYFFIKKKQQKLLQKEPKTLNSFRNSALMDLHENFLRKPFQQALCSTMCHSATVYRAGKHPFFVLGVTSLLLCAALVTVHGQILAHMCRSPCRSSGQLG